MPSWVLTISLRRPTARCRRSRASPVSLASRTMSWIQTSVACSGAGALGGGRRWVGGRREPTVLVLEVPVEGTLHHARVVADVVDAGRGKALLGETLRGYPEQLVSDPETLGDALADPPVTLRSRHR